ncbi:hypothetical protein GY45DRAFT_1316681 [Cubamyces sp. BRFM 1775]|nr:hypothetical protein GY45DRAFT_1316681 [Cubamyces sp. BRFM 1775]
MPSSPGDSSPTGTPSTATTTSFSTSSSSILDGSSTGSNNSDFFPSATTGAAAATGSGAPGGGPPSSSLYLFTFLATLFLLLAISSAIIMRGIFLRRRFRRRLEEAIAAGVLLSPTDDGTGGAGRSGGGRRKLKRPTLFDVTVLPPVFSTASPQDGRWEKTMPVSASVASEKPGLDPLPKTESTPSVNTSHHGHLSTARIFQALESAGFMAPRARLRRGRNAQPPRSEQATAQAASPPGPPSPPIPLEQRDPVLRADELQVAVLIAMPNPRRTAYVSPKAPPQAPPSLPPLDVHLSDSGKGKARSSEGWEDCDEEGVPDVLFGSARVPLVCQDESQSDREST